MVESLEKEKARARLREEIIEIRIGFDDAAKFFAAYPHEDKRKMAHRMIDWIVRQTYTPQINYYKGWVSYCLQTMETETETETE